MFTEEQLNQEKKSVCNPHTVELINDYKNVILNHLCPIRSDGTRKGLHLCFMTNKEFKNNPYISLKRRDNGHAHIRYQTFEETKEKWCNYDDEKYAYITSSVYILNNIECLTLRKDLVLWWCSHTSTHDVNVLLIDKVHSKIAEFPVKEIVDLYTKSLNKKLTPEKKENYCITKQNPLTSQVSPSFQGIEILGFDLSNFSKYFEEMDSSFYIPQKMQFENHHNFAPDMWHPEYIGNTSYATSRRSSCGCRIRIYDKDGNRCLFPEVFRSINEAFNTLKKNAKFSTPKRTFIRRSADHKPIITENGNIILVARKNDIFIFPDIFDVSTITKKDTVFGAQIKTNADISKDELDDILKNCTVADVNEIKDMLGTPETTIDDFEIEINPDILLDSEETKYIAPTKEFVLKSLFQVSDFLSPAEMLDDYEKEFFEKNPERYRKIMNYNSYADSDLLLQPIQETESKTNLENIGQCNLF